MISFTSFLIENSNKLPKTLLEGGNVTIKGTDAQHINLEDHDRDIVSELIMKGLVELNNKFKSKYNLYIWQPSVLKSGAIFSGSTKHFFDSNISTKKFIKIKPKVGDIDLMVDEELKSIIKDFMNSNEDVDFGPMKLIGSKAAGDQTITLWRLEPTGINIQVDLEFTEYNGNEPTEWSKFSHSSSFEDLTIGIKGAFHKLLMTALTGPKKVDSILQLKTKQKEISAGLHALSVKGIRQKYEQVGEQDGKPVIRETGSTDFITDFVHIFKAIFDVEPSEADIKKFWSFTGIIDLIKKHMYLQETEKVLDAFVDRIFGESAQGLYKGEPNRDLDEKMIALKYAEEMLQTKFNPKKLAQIQEEFYKRYK